MDLVSRVLTRSLKLPTVAGLLAATFVVSVGDVSAQVVAEAAPITMDGELVAVEKGLELEQAHRWGDAVRHYEVETRKYPNNTKLYQRLVD